MSKKKPSKSSKKETRQSPEQLWGAGQWRVIKLVSGVISFAILLAVVTFYRALGENLTFQTHILPNFVIDLVLAIVGVFFLLSPWSPLQIYGKPKHRWLFGWVFFMALGSHFLANIVGVLLSSMG